MDYNILYETDYDTVVARYEDKRKNNKSNKNESLEASMFQGFFHAVMYGEWQ